MLARLVLGKARKLRPLPPSPFTGRVGSVRFEFDFSLSPVISMMYRGTYQPEIAHTMRRLLQEGDVFVDVGANIGYFSAVAMNQVGTSGSVLAFEPVPDYAQRLRRLADMNPEHHLSVICAAVGEREETIRVFLSGTDNIGANSIIARAVLPYGDRSRLRSCDLTEYSRP